MKAAENMNNSEPKKSTNNTWPEYLNPKIISVVNQKLKFETMTPVQVNNIHFIIKYLNGSD